ncbi:TIR domain-containing protein [Bacillus toyonensis]|uniref:TIR domain-containing protein n=1 Tax=Bacillus toyonensis TaxID=155322 RepID=UPI00381CA3CD
MERPKVFIGSSSESIYLVNALFSNLDKTGQVEATPWCNGVFNGGKYTMEDLSKQLELNDFGVFILDADDIVISRGTAQPTSRDNVLFELGLFMGKLGRERVFFITPKELDRDEMKLEILIPVDEHAKHSGKEYIEEHGKTFEKKIVNNNLKIPSDLFGITPLQYRLRSDGNWQAALSGVSSELSANFFALKKKENPQNQIGELTEQISQLTETLDELVEKFGELEKLNLFNEQARGVPQLLNNDDYDRLLEAIDSAVLKEPFNQKGISLFRLEGDQLVQCGMFKDVGQYGKTFSLNGGSASSGKINVVEAFKSGQITTVDKKNREYLISIPFINKYVLTFHYFHTIKVKNAIDELNCLFKDGDLILSSLESIFSKAPHNELALKGEQGA